MKKSVRLLSVILGAMLCFSCCALVACGGNGSREPVVQPQKTCLVQVEGGSGGGYYYVDTNCTVKAETPTGKQFIKWVSGTTDLSPNAEYTFTVTKNIKLKAVFEDDIADTTLHTVNVHWGNGSGNYFAGKKITVSVIKDYINATFTGWEATYTGADGKEVKQQISTEREFELTVDKSMYITACYDATPLVTPDNTNGQMFRMSDGGAYEMDRQKNGDGSSRTAFVAGCEFLLYNVYEANEDDELVLVGQGKIVQIPKDGEYYHRMYSMDGKLYANLKGGNGNIYQDVTADKDKIRTILNMELNKTYYIGVRAMGGDDTPIDSDESAQFAVKL